VESYRNCDSHEININLCYCLSRIDMHKMDCKIVPQYSPRSSRSPVLSVDLWEGSVININASIKIPEKVGEFDEDWRVATL